ncbi:hypothetical protein LP090_11475 [Moraxella bovis]|uniref:Uncharacterized protein n=2 Tax=Moraxella TaxID=475 RepID=A0A378QVL0_9GAMM|nr:MULTISPECIES: hypothetical protein [Moraxella]UYZ68818.1 hypothetical protein LP122_01515 [Moraxella bovis]UYZ71194.1 hypothetical protein LP089_01560 [Moraxella bovis]UYZ72891.1 hypothetical protein LP105_11090 [Moraxella bovis]UZA14489.1 hypothetical protein LP102_01515 [Moraxella bovis]UZA27150.1 hypothetical protein LP119_11340 [Moraxella bovis]
MTISNYHIYPTAILLAVLFFGMAIWQGNSLWGALAGVSLVFGSRKLD